LKPTPVHLTAAIASGQTQAMTVLFELEVVSLGDIFTLQDASDVADVTQHCSCLVHFIILY
jgi:hypothetical protein